MADRDRTQYGYATSREKSQARKRIRARKRQIGRANLPRPPRGASAQQVKQFYRDRRRFLNYTPGRNGSPDRDYGNEGLSSRHMISESQLDIEMKMEQARLEHEARQRGKEIGGKIRRRIVEGLRERSDG